MLPLERYTVKDLKFFLAGAGLVVGGVKDELVRRLEGALRGMGMIGEGKFEGGSMGQGGEQGEGGEQMGQESNST
ncbi:hypothetical protein B484DRAFT_414551 [Ochromonadaceae sp. CCMP2298]|nr:hypothetical protein B484DRAFT_414551 [Ochromonadaceae sp. CCMP2298]